MREVWHPRPYHEIGLRRMLSEPGLALLWDPGLGKTSVTLAAIAILLEQRVVTSVLVVAPLRVCFSVWPVEAQKWSQFEHLDVAVVHGSQEKRARIATADHQVYVVNPEGLIWLLEYWNGWVPDVLIVDESTKFKNANSQRFKALRKHLNSFKRRYCLTGTPAPNGLEDLWAQAFIVDGGKALGERIGLFRDRWFVRVGNPEWHQWAPRVGAEEEIYAALAPIAMRLDKRDHLEGLPEVLTTDVPVTMTKEAWTIYNEMEREFVVALQGGTVDAETAASTSTKLRQIATGRVYDDQHRAHVIHREKQTALGDLLEQLGESAMVVYEFQHECDAIVEVARARGLSYEVLGGADGAKTAKTVTQVVDQWNKGKLDLLIVHPGSAGHGLNLQDGGRAQIWYGHSWNREHVDQTIARLWRSGQQFTTLVYRLVCTGTIEEVVLASNALKGARQLRLLDALKEHYLG